ncbi:hypothetical protein MBSD_n2885 [Mizugakiibacter sediminis]|uniref:Uncharacterized protein n=2 Tax=Mizugakiibacter sediminis TaxID=1475481 RepID=A0A0K8QRN3_9GAMM|nr:hypothetical protein MBSD_n2885 [Mizugakiibacter sediminis]
MGDPYVIKWDVIDINDMDRFVIRFERVHSQWRQGVWLSTDGGIEIKGNIYPSIYIWSDAEPKETEFLCHTALGKLHVYNVWDRGRGVNSQAYSSGMKIEKTKKGLRYACNDIGFDTSFDKLVFVLEKIN